MILVSHEVLFLALERGLCFLLVLLTEQKQEAHASTGVDRLLCLNVFRLTRNHEKSDSQKFPAC